MATDTLLITGGSPLDQSNNTYVTHASGTDNDVQTVALNNTPTWFETATTDFTYTIEYGLNTALTDDTVTLSFRIVNGTTILVAANSAGGYINIGNVTSTTDSTLSNVSVVTGVNGTDGYVNTTATQADWDGATIEFLQGYNKNAGPDNVSAQIDYFAIAGTYNVQNQTVDLTGGTIASAEAFGAGTSNQAIPLEGSGISSGELFGTPYAALGRFIQNVGNIASAEALGTPNLQAVLLPTGISSAETVSTAADVLPGPVTAFPTGISSAEAFGDLSNNVNVPLDGSGITSAETLGSPTTNTFIHATGFVDGASNFGTAQVNITAFPVGKASDEAFGTATSNQAVPVTGIASAETLGSPTTNTFIHPTGFVDGASDFGTAQVNITAFPVGKASDEAFGLAVTNQYIMNPTPIDSQETIGDPIGVHMIVHANSFVDGGEDFGSFITHRFVPTEGSGIASQETFGTFTSNVFVHAPAITSEEVFGNAQVNITAYHNSIASAEAFGDFVSHMTLPMGTNGIVSEETFGTFTSNVFVQNPTPIDTQETFGTPQVNTVAYPIGWDDSTPFGIPQINITVHADDSIVSQEAFGNASYVLFVNGNLVENADVMFGYGYSKPPAYYINMPPQIAGYFINT